MSGLQMWIIEQNELLKSEYKLLKEHELQNNQHQPTNPCERRLQFCAPFFAETVKATENV